MIGQKNLLNTFKRQIEEGTFPRFSILCGAKGGGKKLLSIELGQMLTDSNIAFIEPKVDNIRELVVTAYKVTMPTLYILADADNMSPAAKNALLKVTEEPPNNAYFIMTLLSVNNTLPTIRSRATIYHIDPYSAEELSNYFYDNYSNLEHYNEYQKIMLEICETPGEINSLMSVDVFSFYAYVGKVIDNIDKVSTSNVFKIADKLAFKETDLHKYDLALFYKAFMMLCLKRMEESDIDRYKYAKGVEITSKSLQTLKNVSLNRQYAFDMWILNIREEWNYGDFNS